MDRIRMANPEDWIKGKMLDGAIDKREQSTRIFYYGYVINNNDPKNSNRIQVRIPFLDDNFYNGRTKDEGDKVLPWCSSFSRNFIATPENKSVVIVALMDPKAPFWGRIYIDSIPELSATDIFDSSRLIPETKTYENWNNIELHHNIFLKSKPQQPKEFNAKENVKYPMGIRGKGKNRLMLGKDSTEIYQNEAQGKKESFLKFTQNVHLEAGDEMFLLSKQGGTHYHPVFDQPLYSYLTTMNDMIRQIVTVQNTLPSLCNINMLPNLPSKEAKQLVPKLAAMYAKFNKLKLPGQGASKKITIN